MVNQAILSFEGVYKIFKGTVDSVPLKTINITRMITLKLIKSG